MIAIFKLKIFFIQDDASSCSDDSGSDVFKSIPKNTTAFRVWKIEVSLNRKKYFIDSILLYISYFEKCLTNNLP